MIELIDSISIIWYIRVVLWLFLMNLLTPVLLPLLFPRPKDKP